MYFISKLSSLFTSTVTLLLILAILLGFVLLVGFLVSAIADLVVLSGSSIEGTVSVILLLIFLK